MVLTSEGQDRVPMRISRLILTRPKERPGVLPSATEVCQTPEDTKRYKSIPASELLGQQSFANSIISGPRHKQTGIHTKDKFSSFTSLPSCLSV